MTKEERLAALKNLESGLQTEIIRATASPDQGFYCVKLDKNADLDLVEEFRIYADLKWEVSYFFTLPSMNHYIGLNYISQKEANILRTGFLEWVQAEITKLEQPPFDPKEVIEAAAADDAGMDAAESLLDREQMKAELRTLWKTVGRQEAELVAMEASRDEYKKLYQEALAAAESQRIAKDGEIAALKKEINKLNGEAINQEAIINTLKYKIEQQPKKKVKPEPVKLPVHGDIIEARVSSEDDEWAKVRIYADKPENPRFDRNGMSIKACQETYDKGDWRWPEPRTRTAADAKIGEIVLFWDTMQTRDHGPVIGLGDSSVFVQASDGKVHRLPHHEFGPTGWRFEKEETK